MPGRTTITVEHELERMTNQLTQLNANLETSHGIVKENTEFLQSQIKLYSDYMLNANKRMLKWILGAGGVGGLISLFVAIVFKIIGWG